MTTTIRFILLVSTLIITSACPSSSSTQTPGGCQSDLECGAFARCDIGRGLCLCTSDEACDQSEFCNVAGFCQPVLECFSNDDCVDVDNPNGRCDIDSGNCVTIVANVLECTRDSQCGFGAVCDNQRCAPGCRVHGDCPLGQPCLDGQCDATPGACADQTFCAYGQLCDEGTRRCVDHAERAMLCQACNPGGGCGADSCIIDTTIAPTPCDDDSDCPRGECRAATCLSDADCFGGTCEGNFLFVPGTCSNSTCQGGFCGSRECSEDNPCPRGYDCNELGVVTEQRCTVGSGTAECGEGRGCSPSGENQEVGFCSCASDGDCPGGTSCVNPGPTGRCIIGTICAPANGLVCEAMLE
jgi:hypothetical protein